MSGWIANLRMGPGDIGAIFVYGQPVSQVPAYSALTKLPVPTGSVLRFNRKLESSLALTAAASRPAPA